MSIRVLAVIFVFLIPVSLQAQKVYPEHLVDEPAKPRIDMEFYLAEEMSYPMEASEQQIKGEATVTLQIDPDGNIREVSFLKSVGYGIEAEVERLLKGSSPWYPAKLDDEAVHSLRTLQVRYGVGFDFRLSDPKEMVAEEPEAEVPDELFFVVEDNASFPGGSAALYKYLADNIQYPESAKRIGIEGRVYVQITIQKDGTITDVKTVRGIGAGCNEEAERVLKSMPKWHPATRQGNPVISNQIIPVTFKKP